MEMGDGKEGWMMTQLDEVWWMMEEQGWERREQEQELGRW
jgi:hypothetical protein